MWLLEVSAEFVEDKIFGGKKYTQINTKPCVHSFQVLHLPTIEEHMVYRLSYMAVQIYWTEITRYKEYKAVS